MEHPLISLFSRDLDRLYRELETFPEESDLWRTSGSITNSPGNLALHIMGNLQHFIGAVLGGSGYVRDRAHEFEGKDIPREKLLAELTQTQMVVRQTLENLPETILSQPYPVEVFGEPMRTDYFLIHLQGHLNYHLGQINYFRRAIIEK